MAILPPAMRVERDYDNSIGLTDGRGKLRRTNRGRAD
jgi:hypothetical protein